MAERMERTQLVIAFLVLLTMLVLVFPRGISKREEQMSGPANIQLYDIPLWYPNFVARRLMKWDGDKRCSAYCSQEPCAIWCR